ncbi:MAG: ISL3 family transposase [Pseudomonadota bacterium]
MLLKTILNHCQKFKCFVYGEARFVLWDEGQCLEVDIEPRKGSAAICSSCHKAAPCYDHAKEPRRFEFVPMWGYAVFFVYVMRRVDCPRCGVKIEDVPWADGKHQLTKTYMQFLASWARSLSWTEVGERFQTSWEKVFHAVEYVVEWGLQHRNLDGITAIGVDEIQWKKNHKYLTLVYQINSGGVRLLWIGKDRTVESFSAFFDMLGEKRSALIEHVCSDMWKPYLRVIKERIGQAVHILDRFHIVARINKALDEVRANEHRCMKAAGCEPLLTKARWLLLKRAENLTEEQEPKLRELLRYNLQSIRAYLLKEEFQTLWTYVSPSWAGQFIDRWTGRVMRSRIEPLKKEARTIRRHKALILNWFKAKGAFSSGIVEGLNNKAKLTMRKSYGFREFTTIEMALYHCMGGLPEPPLAHRFC